MSFYIPVNGDNIVKYHCLGEIFGVGKRMYITGGVGSTNIGEAFTVEYDLPNRTA